MASKKSDQNENFFALLTFDLKDVKAYGKKDGKVRRAVHKKLKAMGLKKLIKKLKGADNKSVTFNTFTGLFPKSDRTAMELKKYLRGGAKEAIVGQGVAGRVVVAVTEPNLWASTAFHPIDKA